MGLERGSRIGRCIVVVALVAVLLVGLTHVADHDHGCRTDCALCATLVHVVQPEAQVCIAPGAEPRFVGAASGWVRTPSRDFVLRRGARAPPASPPTR